ncbi:MAG: glycosyl hydrolase [Pseudomonadota bacterium]
MTHQIGNTESTSLITSILHLVLAFIAVISFGLAPSARAERIQTDPADYFARLEWRNIGPNRGGRSIASVGSTQRPFEYFFGATGGGLWKTTDGGTNWNPVTDGQINSSSVGAIALDPKNPDVVYIGMGEGQLRNNVLQGDGIYKSIDGGKTWRHLGLEQTKTITTIRVHPTKTNIVYVAALGDPYAPNPERGIYRSNDGGESWEKVLYRSQEAGAIDLSMDPQNPNTLYATLWQVYRKPWLLWSGGPQSGLFKSVDGGENWTEITANPGLPPMPLGKITVAVSPADSNRLYANIEAKQGGLYLSDNAGATWTYVNGNPKLWQRSFYFLQIRPDPIDRDTVYVLSFRLEKSTDGGKTFSTVPTRHPDIHDLWIDPSNSERMIVSDDGGASISVNGGKTWTDQDFPTAQIYRVTTTNDFPYHVCGSQQDNFANCVLSRSETGIGEQFQDFGLYFNDIYGPAYTVATSEMGIIAPHPEKSDIFFTGITNGLVRFDRRTGQFQDVQPYPYAVMGQSAASMKERWGWNYPIVFAPQPPHALYIGSQRLWRSLDEGQSWNPISDDLTRALPETLGDTGGPIRLDQDGPEVYGTLLSIAPSVLEPKVIWTGSDDGLLQVTRNAGRKWTDVTPTDMPIHSRITSIDVSHHDKGTVYVSARRHEMADRAPYVWKTEDYGKSWARIDNGLPTGDFVHVIRADKKQEKLLFVGTEHGIYVSFDDGTHWSSLSQNLPDTPVMDMQVKNNDLVIATHGRSFYLLEGVSTLRQISKSPPSGKTTLFAPSSAVRRIIPARIDLYLASPAQSGTLEIIDSDEDVIRILFSNKPMIAGAHRFTWDARHRGATVFPGMILESEPPTIGPLALPGNYMIRLTVDGEIFTQKLRVEKDPRLSNISTNDLKEQHVLALKARDATSLANEKVIEIRALRAKIKPQLSKLKLEQRQIANTLLTDIAAIEAKLYQVKNISAKDKIAYPIQLNDRLAALQWQLVSVDAAPTQAQYVVFDELLDELKALVSQYDLAKQKYIEPLNEALTELDEPTIAVRKTAR